MINSIVRIDVNSPVSFNAEFGSDLEVYGESSGFPPAGSRLFGRVALEPLYVEQVLRATGGPLVPNQIFSR